MTAARIWQRDGGGDSSRRIADSPVIVHRVNAEHLARCIIAIRERRKRESAAKVNGEWV